jgi:lipopolysaccharide transport system ATP-binding protein
LAADNIDDVTIGLLIRDRFGQDVFGTNSHHLGASLNVKRLQQYQAKFEVLMDIAPGKYSITLALHSQENHIDDCYHWIDNEVTFEVAGVIGHQFSGVCRLPSSISISQTR